MVSSPPPTHAPLFWLVMEKVADLLVGFEASIIHLSFLLPLRLWVWEHHLPSPCKQLVSRLVFSEPHL